VKIQQARAGGNSFYRIFRDQNDLVVFVYELAVDRSPDGEIFNITTRPATTNFAARFPNADGGKPAPTLSAEQRLPPCAPVNTRISDSSSSAGVGLKVVDTIEVRVGQRAGAPAFRRSFGAVRCASAFLRAPGLDQSGSSRRLRRRATVVGRYAMFYCRARRLLLFDRQSGWTQLREGGCSG